MLGGEYGTCYVLPVLFLSLHYENLMAMTATKYTEML